MSSLIVVGCFVLANFLHGLWLPTAFLGVNRRWVDSRGGERAPRWIHGLVVVAWGFVSFSTAEAFLAVVR